MQIALAPPGMQACTLDIAKFHRTCPINLYHKPFLVVQGIDSSFYINHTHPFGAASANSNLGMITNATVNIWHGEKVSPVLKYKDNLKSFHIPSATGTFHDGNYFYDYDQEEMMWQIAPLKCLGMRRREIKPSSLRRPSLVSSRISQRS